MSTEPTVTLHYLYPAIREGCQYPQSVAMLTRNGVSVLTDHSPNGDLFVSLTQTREGGLEAAVKECLSLIIPIRTLDGFDVEGYEVVKGVLEREGYKFTEVRLEKSTNHKFHYCNM